MAFVMAATLAELPAGKSKQVTLGGKAIGLFNASGTVYAIDDTCPHRGAPSGKATWKGPR